LNQVNYNYVFNKKEKEIGYKLVKKLRIAEF